MKNSHRAQARHDLPGRPAAGEGGDRRDRQREDLGGADVHARTSVLPTTMPQRQPCARMVRRIVANLKWKKNPSVSLLDPARAQLRCRGTLRRRAAGQPHPYDMREVIAAWSMAAS